MLNIDVIQKMCDLIREEDGRVDDKPFKKEWEELMKWHEILDKYVGDDKKFYRIFFEYDMADGLYQGATNDYYFREGFLCGARLALEICGFENKNR